MIALAPGMRIFVFNQHTVGQKKGQERMALNRRKSHASPGLYSGSFRSASDGAIHILDCLFL